MVPPLQATTGGEGFVTEAEIKPFDPARHRFGPAHWFEDLAVGQSFYINSHGDIPVRRASTLETYWRSRRFPLDDYTFSA